MVKPNEIVTIVISLRYKATPLQLKFDDSLLQWSEYALHLFDGDERLFWKDE